MSTKQAQQAHRIIELLRADIDTVENDHNQHLADNGVYPDAVWWVERRGLIRSAQDYLDALYSIITAENEREGLESLRHVRNEREQKTAERSAARKAEHRDWYLDTRANDQGPYKTA